MRRTLSCLAVVLALVAPGCSAIIDSSRYVGTGNDASVDAFDPTVDADIDGAVTNTPPVLSAVSLDNYFPMQGDTLRAVAGEVFDADGDTTGLRYQWFDGATEIAGANTPALDTTSLSPAAQLRVEAWANDRVDGPHVSAGPVTLAADGTRWRQILPNDGDGFPAFVWDAPNRRIVRFVDDGVWEYAIGSAGFLVQRLPATGTAPADDEAQVVMHDVAHQRMLVFSRADRAAVYALDLSVRGHETWTRIVTGGSAPTVELLTMVHYDAPGERIWLIGGFDDSTGALSGIYSLDVSAPGAETWTQHTTTGATFPPLFGAALAADATTPSRLYLIGGVTTPAEDTFVMQTGVLALDLTDAAVNVTELAATLPGPVWGAGGATDPATGNVVMYGGFSGFGASFGEPVGLRVFDPALGSITDVAAAIDPVFAGALAPDAFAPGHFVSIAPAGDLSGNGFSLRADDVTATAVEGLATDARPHAIADTLGRIGGNSLFLFGGSDGGQVVPEQWSADVVTWRWTPATTMADAVTAGTPPFRYGVAQQTSMGDFSTPDLLVVGGALDTGLLADMSAWTLESDNRWIERRLAAGSTTTPPARVGHVAVAPRCGVTAMVIYGGEDATGTPVGGAAALDCPADRSCTWNISSAFAGRSWSSAIASGGIAYVFGGRDATGPLADFIGIDICRSTPEPATITFTGAGPSARFAHAAAPVDDGSSIVSFFVFGGEDGTALFDDTYRFQITGEGSGAWEAITPVDTVRPRARAHHLAFWDSARSRLLVVGGASSVGGYSTMNDVWELRIRP